MWCSEVMPVSHILVLNLLRLFFGHSIWNGSVAMNCNSSSGLDSCSEIGFLYCVFTSGLTLLNVWWASSNLSLLVVIVLMFPSPYPVMGELLLLLLLDAFTRAKMFMVPKVVHWSIDPVRKYAKLPLINKLILLGAKQCLGTLKCCLHVLHL